MNIGQDTTHNLPFQNGNSYNSISQIDDTLKCRPVQRYREREWFIFTYIRTCIPDKRRCRAQTKCNWVRNSIIVFQRWLMKCRLLLVNLSTKGLMVQSIASHAIDTISRWKYGHFLNRWKCNYALYPWTAFINESHATVIQMNPFQVISENTKFLWIWILIDDMYDA